MSRSTVQNSGRLRIRFLSPLPTLTGRLGGGHGGYLMPSVEGSEVRPLILFRMGQTDSWTRVAAIVSERDMAMPGPRTPRNAGNNKQRLGFEVSTHIFNELGRLLVARDSTALSELIKNAYDADATFVRIYGENLADPKDGLIRVTDDGVGMTHEEFAHGFLRIASGQRRTSDRRSLCYKRRFTGEKGIGRLAAHKLARVLEITTLANHRGTRERFAPFRATIDWDAIEQKELLDRANQTIIIEPVALPRNEGGTVLSLRHLRRGWNEPKRTRFAFQAISLQPPEPFVTRIDRSLVAHKLLFDMPLIRDTHTGDPGFRIELTGDFAMGEDYWALLTGDAEWVLEAKCDGKGLSAHVAPTTRIQKKYKQVKPEHLTRELYAKVTPKFEARIFVRAGRTHEDQLRQFTDQNGGIRIYMEGFRVLPYGDPKDDWLDIQRDYSRRTNVLDDTGAEKLAKEEQLTFLPQRSFAGAVFLTESGAQGLEMLVNREGFVDDDAFDALARSVRWAVNILLRARARATAEERAEKRAERQRRRAGAPSAAAKQPTPSVLAFETVANDMVQEAREAVQRAQAKIAQRGVNGAQAALKALDTELLETFTSHSSEIVDYASLIRVLATLGTQMASFVHEARGLLGSITVLERGMRELHQHVDAKGATVLRKLQVVISDVRLSLERQVSYLSDVAAADARRRRSRQNVHDAFERAKRMFEKVASARDISIRNRIPEELRTPPMFASEIRTVFINLLSNAVRAAGNNGKIEATAGGRDGRTWIRLENTGRRVRVSTAERWFKPFETTSVDVDGDLAQGMGLGLPITRATLQPYNGEIEFVEPRKDFATAIIISMPG